MGLNPNLQLHLVETTEDVHSFLNWLSQDRQWLGVDTETGGLEWWNLPLRTVQFGDETAGWCIPFDLWKGLIAEVFSRYQGSMVMHNAKFDLHFLEHNGVFPREKRSKVHDSLLLSRVLDPHLPAGLKPVAERLVDRRAVSMQVDLSDGMRKHKWNWETVPIEFPPYWTYAALDPVLTVEIWKSLYQGRAQNYLKPYDVDLASSMVILDMEQRGVALDVEYCQRQSDRLESYQEEFKKWALATYGLENPSSDRQVIKALQQEGCAFTKYTDKGQIAADADVLKSLGHPLATALVDFRHASKMRTTYFDSWMKFEYQGRLHPTFNVSGARTARMSSERPNLQNVPRSRRLRWALVPKPDHQLVLADYDQIELRLLAHFAQEQAMISAINNGEDLHSYTAKLVYKTKVPSKEQRRVAKSSNFAKIYGAGVAKFADTAGVTVEEAQMFLDGYDQEFPTVKLFQEKIANEARQSAAQSDDGLAHVHSEYIGRQQIVEPNKAYKLVNYLIQGTAADVLKVKMLEIDATELGKYMVVPIHDEIAFEVPEDEVEWFAHYLHDVMEDHTSFSVPLSVGVEVVSRWGEKYEEGT